MEITDVADRMQYEIQKLFPDNEIGFEITPDIFKDSFIAHVYIDDKTTATLLDVDKRTIDFIKQNGEHLKKRLERNVKVIHSQE